MNNDVNLRAGLIGLGMMGRHHARILRSLEGVELVCIADPQGDQHSASSGIPLERQIEDIISYNLDYAVVATPTKFHEEVALKLADAGISALIEKPLASEVEQARRIADAFSSAKVIGAVGHIERYNPALQEMRKRISEGQLGEIYQISTRRQGPFPARISDVGVVKDLATHDIDLTAWVLDAEYESLGAQTSHKSGRTHEDLISITARLTNGVIANHLVNWLSPIKERITAVTGEKGTLVADTLTADLTFFENGNTATTWDQIARFRGVSEGDVIRYAIEKPEPLRTEHENFRDLMLGRPNDTVTMEQAFKTVFVAQAAIDSAKSQETINLAERLFH